MSQRPFVKLWVDGERLDAHAGRVLSVEVEERSQAAASVRVSLDMTPTGDDEWDALADGRFALLHRITVAFGVGPTNARLPDIEEVVFDGFVTDVEARFGPKRVPDSMLDLHGLDASCLMHLDERTRNWEAKTDAEIARAIYEEYGFATEVGGSSTVEETAPVRDAARSGLLQRCTDAQFLQMLADRNGFEARVEWGGKEVSAGPSPEQSELVGHFRLPAVDDEPLPPLTLMPRTHPSLVEFTVRWESHGPTMVLGRHIDERTRRIWSVDLAQSRLSRMGTTSRADILTERLQEILTRRQGVTVTPIQTRDVPHEEIEVENLAWGSYLPGDWLAEGTGIVEGRRYPAIVRAGRPIGLERAGTLLNGMWYVRRARHRWEWDKKVSRYEVDVTLVRNALGGVA